MSEQSGATWHGADDRDPEPHPGHDDYKRCPYRHFWPPETAEANWTTTGNPVRREDRA